MSLAAELIKKFEGWRADAYPDPASADGRPYTIGWGFTGRLIDGRPIVLGLRITSEEGEADLAHRLAALQGVIESLLKVPANENQLAALCSLAWNIGTHAFGTSEVLRELNLGNYQAAADAFRNWERAGGKPHFLHDRREAERVIFLREAAPNA
jgi:lysozyme